MTRNFSKTARLTVTSTLTALVLAAALPQAGFAVTSDAGIWKIDPAKSQFSFGFATLTVQRAASVKPAAGPFLVISKGNVYLVTRAAANDTKGVKPVDYTNMSGGKGVLIGTNVQSTDHCGLRCQAGLVDSRPMTLSFKALDGGAKQINEMLASNGKSK
jgi:hypothetical protein